MSSADRQTAVARFMGSIAHSALRLYIAFALLTILPILIFSAYADHTLAQHSEREAQAENMQIARLSATLVEEHFRQNTTLLESIAGDKDFLEAWKKRDLKTVEQHMTEAHALQPDSSLVSTYEPDGTMNSIAPMDANVIGQNFAFRDWYKGVAHGWQPYVSEVYRINAVPHTLAVAIAVPIKDERGQPIGIIAAAYSLNRVSGWLKPAEYSGARRISVVDQNGNLLAAADIDVYKPPIDLSQYEPVRRLMKGESGNERLKAQGEERYAAYVPIPSFRWGILVEQPTSEVQRGVLATRQRTVGLGVLLVMISIASGLLIAMMYRNQRRLSERVTSLALSEERYRSLIDGATLGIYRSDERGFISANPALVKMLGYDSEQEVLALDPERDVYVDSALRNRLIHDYRETEDVASVEVQWKRKDGRLVTIRLSGRRVPNERGETTDIFEMIAEDVTERHNLEQQLRQSQKMEAVGRLAGGIAHDFNNLLTVISGYNELIEEMLEKEHPAVRELHEVKRATERATALTRQLLAFSRQQVLEPKLLDLNTVIAGMETLLRKLVGEDINVTMKLAPEIYSIKADPGQIGQIIMNLAVNARDAMPHGGQLTIETVNSQLDENTARDHDVNLEFGDYVLLAVSDSGTGMDETTRSRIFEPFFTTKALGKGTGLGLSTVYGVVKQSGGFIWVYSEPGIGTTFKIYLPKAAGTEQAKLQPSRASGDLRAHGQESVLILEDEDAVRNLAGILLKRAGYEVFEAETPEHALAIMKERSAKKQQIHLLLTDVVLRQSSGRDVAHKIMQISPETRVLYMSGYTDDAVLRHGVLSASAQFLQKPFTTESLTRKVREVIDSPPQPDKARAGD